MVRIARSWRQPRVVITELQSDGTREDRNLMYLMLACLVIFASRAPALARAAEQDPTVALEIQLAGALFGWLFIMPLICFALAAASRLIMGLLRGQGNWYSARLALFWSLLAASPFWLLNGLVSGSGLPKTFQSFLGMVALAAFLIIWLTSLSQTEFGEEARP